MAKYQPRIIINNPEKNVPDSIVEQFFLAIKTADIDKIRDFALMYKNKYNLIEKGAKGSELDKTPIHVVLELDDKVANNRTKLQLMKYLDEMGAPIDLPDAANVWPIHLAAALQSEKILDFLLKKQVELYRLDSSNNTPLHYAVIGKEVACPKNTSIKDLVPAQKFDKLVLNKSLEDINLKLIQLLSSNSGLNHNLIHMINTVMKIPEMYVDDKMARNLQTNVINIFTEAAVNPAHTPDPVSGLTNQQIKLEQLIENTYALINEELLRGLTNAIDLAPNNGGWGPSTPTGPDPTDVMEPNNLQRITKYTRNNLKTEIQIEYHSLRTNIVSIGMATTDAVSRLNIPTIITTVDREYIDALIFCPACTTSGNGERVALTKMLYLLAYGYYKLHYGNNFALNVTDNFRLLDRTLYGQILTNPFPRNPANWARDQAGILFMSSIPSIINSPEFNGVRTNMDIALRNIAQRTAYPDCINDELRRLFTDSDEDQTNLPIGKIPHDEYHSTLGKNTIKDLLTRPPYDGLLESYNKLRPLYRSDRFTWFDMLNQFITEVSPVPDFNPNVPNYDANNIFNNPGLIPGKRLPMTPFAKSSQMRIRGIYESYTYLELFRMMNAIEKFLLRSNFQITDYPDIFNYPINRWDDYVDLIANQNIYRTNTKLSQSFPELIFLYRMLIARVGQHIRGIITNCVGDMIQSADPADPSGQLLSTLVDDAIMMNLLLPSVPDRTEFTQTDQSDPFADLKMRKWDNSSRLMNWFGQYQNQIPDSLWKTIILSILVLAPDANVAVQMINYLDYNNLGQLRIIIEENVATNANTNTDTINSIINNGEFRSSIRQYFGTYGQERTGPIGTPPNIENRAVLSRYNVITRDIFLTDSYNFNLALLESNPKRITDGFFLIETLGYFFVQVKQQLLKLQMAVSKINFIVADISAFINNRTFYYIPQIFLPALVKQSIIAVNYLIWMQNYLAKYNNRKAIFYPLIDITGIDNSSIISLADTFVTYVNNELKSIYTGIMDIIAYHNNVVDFLNYTSAIHLANSTVDSNLRAVASDVFTMNLIPLEQIIISTGLPNLNALADTLRLYQIPQLGYYSDGDQNKNLRWEIFTSGRKPASGQPYDFVNYRNIILYQRHQPSDLAKVSDSPVAGQNSQLNLTAINTGSRQSDYLIHDIPKSIDGEWLDLALNVTPYDPRRIKYADAFIAYFHQSYQFDWLNGMPPSIRRIVGPYLKIIKQQVMEEVIQYVVNNKYKPVDIQDKALADLYDDIRKLGNEATYTNIDSVKIYIVIGKLVDAIINQLLEYSIRQSISAWILSFATNDPANRNITDVINRTIEVVRQKDYLKIALNEVDNDAIDQLLNSNSAHTEYKLSQIEPDPSNLKYASSTNANEFIHYLYNINYFSTGNINSNAKCYHINPDIARKLITSLTINAKNSDGKTALHLAVEIMHPELVSLLVSYGANPKSYADIHGQTPSDMGLILAQNHTKFTAGPLVINSIENFVQPFNDLLVSRLADEKFGNNIIKNVTMAIPIQLSMYNHMFHLYLENYRYGFTPELKNSVIGLLKKYFGTDNNVFPIDLFQLSNTELPQIVAATDPKILTANTINATNHKKITLLQKALVDINNQIQGLKLELVNLVDTDEITDINSMINALNLKRNSINAKISALESAEAAPKADLWMVSYYESAMAFVQTGTKRGTDLVDFYLGAFNRIGKSKQMYLSIWQSYLDKQLKRAPSMIFSLTTQILNQIVSYGKQNLIDAEIKSELTTIANFYDGVRRYIESKNPNGRLDDDPMLAAEFKQITYLINLILTPAVRNILLNQVFAGITQMDAVNTIVNSNPNAVLTDITTTKFNDQTLDTYLTDVLPTLATKYYTTVYSNSNDVGQKVASANDLFQPLIQIIKSNHTVQLTDDSILIQNLRQYLIPFLSNTYQNFIHHLRLAIYGYERYLLNTYQLAKILESLV